MCPRIARIKSKRAHRAIGHRKRRHQIEGSGHLAVSGAARTIKEQNGATRQNFKSEPPSIGHGGGSAVRLTSHSTSTPTEAAAAGGRMISMRKRVNSGP